MPITEYEGEVTASVSYRVDSARWDDELQGDYMCDMELHDLWMFGRKWTMPELIETFGKNGAQFIEGYIFDNLEWDDG